MNYLKTISVFFIVLQLIGIYNTNYVRGYVSNFNTFYIYIMKKYVNSKQFKFNSFLPCPGKIIIRYSLIILIHYVNINKSLTIILYIY